MTAILLARNQTAILLTSALIWLISLGRSLSEAALNVLHGFFHTLVFFLETRPEINKFFKSDRTLIPNLLPNELDNECKLMLHLFHIEQLVNSRQFILNSTSLKPFAVKIWELHPKPMLF